MGLLNIYFKRVTTPLMPKKPSQHPRTNLRWVVKTRSDTNTVCWGMKGRRWRAFAKTQTLVMAADFSPTSTAIALNLLAQFTAPMQLLRAAFDMHSLPHNFSMGYFCFALGQNEPWLLAGSVRTVPPVDGLRMTKQIAHCNQRAGLQALITLWPDHLLSLPQSRKLPLPRNKKFSRSSLM